MILRRLMPAAAAFGVGLAAGVLVNIIDTIAPHWVASFAFKLPLWVLAVAVIARVSSRVSSAMLRSVVFLLSTCVGYWAWTSFGSAKGPDSDLLSAALLLSVTLAPIVAAAYWWAANDEPSAGISTAFAGAIVGVVGSLCFIDRLIIQFVSNGIAALDEGVPYQLLADGAIALLVVLAMPRLLNVRVLGAVATALLMVPVFAIADAMTSGALAV